MKKFTTTSIKLTALLISGAVLSACAAPKGTAEYQSVHKIEVIQKNRTLSFADPALTGPEQAQLNAFISTYHLQGQGPVTVQASDNGGDQALRTSRIDAIRELLQSAGVSNKQIRTLPFDAEKNAAVTLSYISNTVKAPKCGNWEKGSGYNWSNQRHDNFGCATQRNLGLTIANPGDLIAAPPMDTSDGEKSAGVIDTYRQPSIPTAATATATQ